MFAAQLLEQFKAAAVRQHHIQYYRGGLILRQRLLRALPVMAGMGDKPSCASQLISSSHSS